MDEKTRENIDEIVEKALTPVPEDEKETPATHTETTAKAPDNNTSEKPEEKRARASFKRLTDDDEEEGSVNVSLRTILGGDILAGRWFRRQFGFILLLVFFAIIYVANRYACQQEMIDRINLSDTLLDARYKALTRSSELLEKTLRSHVEESLADSTLRTPTTPPYLLKIEEEP